MLLDLIKHYHKKNVLSSYGVLTIINILLPIAILAIAINLLINGGNTFTSVLIIVLSVFFGYTTFKKLKPFFLNFKFIRHPEEFPFYKRMKEQGLEDAFEDEIKSYNVIESLTKDNPLLITDNLIIGYSNFSLFITLKEELLWAYEYNGCGLVMFNKYKEYGYVQYKTVDGNDFAIAKFEEITPYIYFGLDFDYRDKMHDHLDDTIVEIEERIRKFKEDPEKYKNALLEEIKNKEKEALEKANKEKDDLLKEIETKEKENNLIEENDSIKESEEEKQE